MSDETSTGKVKVIDRRRFTSDGAPRDDAPPPAPSEPEPPLPEPPPSVQPGAPFGPEPSGPEPGSVTPGVGFLDLVDVLAQPAAAFLTGQVPGRGQDPETARFYIDLLAVLQDKTRGRVTPEESRHLDDVLYQLRSLYLAATR